jgi:hypothetical protein
VLCSWCDDPAVFFMVSDRTGAHVDRACAVHMIRWRGAYTRALKLPEDVRAGMPSPWDGLDEVVRHGGLLAVAGSR